MGDSTGKSRPHRVYVVLGDGDRWSIWRHDDNIATEWIGSDGGEPEDQTLVRDFAWVVDALNAAYRLGRDDEAVEALTNKERKP